VKITYKMKMNKSLNDETMQELTKLTDEEYNKECEKKNCNVPEVEEQNNK